MRLVCAFILFICFPSFVGAGEPMIVCKDLAGISETIMMVRQSGVSVEKALSLVENGLKNKPEKDKQILEPVYKKIVELAYEQEQSPTNQGRIEATRNFVKSIIARCSRNKHEIAG